MHVPPQLVKLVPSGVRSDALLLTVMTNGEDHELQELASLNLPARYRGMFSGCLFIHTDAFNSPGLTS